MVDPARPELITHTLAEIIRFRLLMISAGYEDGNDAEAHCRSDPMFKMALDLSPSDRELCSAKSTISRLENLPDARALLRMGRAMVDLYCESFQRVPKRITLDIDDTFDAVHGGQQLRLFNAHYIEPNTAFSRSSCSITKVASSLPFFTSRQTARRQGGSRLPAPPIAARSAPTGRRKPRSYCAAPTVIIAVRRFSTGVGPTVSITSAWASRRPRHCAGISGMLRGQHDGALRGRAEQRQGAPLQGVL